MLTVTEASERAGITPGAIRAAIERKTLTAQRIGPIYLVSTQEIDAYKARTGGKGGRPRGKKKQEGGENG